jgi:hypothetical protein
MLIPEWRKSTYSNGQGSCVEVAGVWRKSSYSNSSSNCVEVRTGPPDAVAVRDSKDRGGPELAFTVEAWAAFVQGVRQGEFDLA